MTKEDYTRVVAVLEGNGYTRVNVPHYMKNETLHYYKSFRSDAASDQPDYSLLFLIWDFTRYGYGDVVDITHEYGIEALVVTESRVWPRIDLVLMVDAVDDILRAESFAHDFYYNLVMKGESL